MVGTFFESLKSIFFEKIIFMKFSYFFVPFWNQNGISVFSHESGGSSRWYSLGYKKALKCDKNFKNAKYRSWAFKIRSQNVFTMLSSKFMIWCRLMDFHDFRWKMPKLHFLLISTKLHQNINSVSGTFWRWLERFLKA